MKNSFVHKGFTVSMNAVRNDADPERARFDVAVAIEDISTGQFLLNETRPVEALDKEQMTAERALNHSAREARSLIDGSRRLEKGRFNMRSRWLSP